MAAAPQIDHPLSPVLAGLESPWEESPKASPASGGSSMDLKIMLHSKLNQHVDLSAVSSMGGERARSELRVAIRAVVERECPWMGPSRVETITEELLEETFGLGPLEPLLQDPSISDILVTTPKMVHVERSGCLYECPVEFKDDAHLLRVIERIVSRVGRRIDASSPLVDARLPDGSRVNAVVAPRGRGRPAVVHPPFRARPPSGCRIGQEPEPDAEHAGLSGSLREGTPQYRRLWRHRCGEDDLAQRSFLLHQRERARGDHRRFRRTTVAAAARRPDGVAAVQYRRPGRDPDTRPCRQRAAHAPGPHHRGRGTRRRSAGHAAGHEYRPRRLADYRSRQHPQGRRFAPGGQW